jgi:hypothetical protein
MGHSGLQYRFACTLALVLWLGLAMAVRQITLQTLSGKHQNSLFTLL